MPSRHLSIRIDADALHQLDAASRRSGQTRSELAKMLIEEGLRIEAHPGIIFRPGPAGRRAALAGGPDVWEVVRAYQGAPGSGEERLKRTAESIGLIPQQVRIALRYYADHQDEIDRWIQRVEEESERAEAAWRREQEILHR